MPRSLSRLLLAVLCTFILAALTTSSTSHASDVDGAGDCARAGTDFGDAPEGFDAYPGILGRFPTCLADLVPGGGQEQIGCGSLSTSPGAFPGYVRHAVSASGIWLASCAPGPGVPDLGIDLEPDAKSSVGSPVSSCGVQNVDCVQGAFGLSFGQDECYGDNDAGLVGPVSFVQCGSGAVTFRIFNCAGPRPMYLNVLIDFNHDGDWNDAELCLPSGSCAPEWAVKNQAFVAAAGCSQRSSAPFTIGTTTGMAWMRITISEQPASDDYPWAGTATMPGGEFAAGETEDYPVHIVSTADCPPYTDFGDAPEDRTAYTNGVIGRFPTCLVGSAAGTMEATAFCNPNSTVPGTTGFVRHVSGPNNPDQFWLGCPVPGGNPADAVDSEINGKMNNLGGGTPSDCDPAVITDCTESLLGPPVLNFGQDECVGDDDAGVAQPFNFDACQIELVRFDAYSCSEHDQTVYINILADWNQDGDWNDNIQCPTGCAPEWPVKNLAWTLTPGCNNVLSPPIRVGLQNGGEGWLRITLTRQPVTDDFPWRGSAGAVGGSFDGGETEDYPFVVDSPIGDPGPYNDRGDAPEGFLRFPLGLGSEGRYPTCTVASPVSGQELQACPPLSTPPGPAGFVNHVHPGAPAVAGWLGCGLPGVDSEPDGKSNTTSTAGNISYCDNTTIVDCGDNTIGVEYGADECPGDGDAGIATPFTFPRCEPITFSYQASNSAQVSIGMYLNVLVDWTDDGDWNDVDNCPFQGGCAPEWAVKNHPINLAPGCNTLMTPSFLTGRSHFDPEDTGRWMRVTLTFQPVTDDFPWAGSEFLPGQAFQGGETEDYVFYMDSQQSPCFDLTQDYGDAPENLPAYAGGVTGRFPTCTSSGLLSTQTFPAGCAPPSTPPGGSGYVLHLFQQFQPPFWLGCSAGSPPFAIDYDTEPKLNVNGAVTPQCGTTVTDCDAVSGALTFGQDECYGDDDAGLTSQVVFPGCATTSFTYKAELCADSPAIGYLNVLVDWNHDGDWNDVEQCSPAYPCAPEWAVKNHVVNLVPGCATYNTPSIQAGGPDGPAWMRVTLSPTPASDDFPWSGAPVGGSSYFDSGETEDYIALIQGSPVDVETIAIAELQFGPATPNPGRELATMRLALPREGRARVVVYDAAGRLVRTLLDEATAAGEHAVAWNYRDADGGKVAAGVYLLQLQFADRVLTQRVVHLK